jgi:hypothetical protein
MCERCQVLLLGLRRPCAVLFKHAASFGGVNNFFLYFALGFCLSIRCRVICQIWSAPGARLAGAASGSALALSRSRDALHGDSK